MAVKMYSSIMRMGRFSPEKLNKVAGIKEIPKTIDPSIITIGSLIKPPKDLSEFEDRLEMFLYELQNLFFGLSHDVGTGKSLKRDKSTEALVDALCNYEKHLKNEATYEHLNTYQFLKSVLETDAPLFGQDEYLLGAQRDRSGLRSQSRLSDSKQNITAVRCAAQLLWHLRGSRIPDIRAMVRTLLDKKNPIFVLLELGRFNSLDTIEDWVRPVCPLPQRGRKKKRSKDLSAFGDIIPIPDIFTENRINFLQLRFALISITRVMKALNYSLDAIVSSRPIALLMESLRFYPQRYAREWVEEAHLSNGSIFG